MEPENPEERKKRLNRERQRRWRSQQSQETLNRLRKEASERRFCRLLTENIEQTKRRRWANSQSQARRRLRETEEEAQARRLANAQSQARRRKRKTEEQTRGRRDDDANCNALQKRIEIIRNQMKRKEKSCRRTTISEYVTALKKIAFLHLQKYIKKFQGSSLTSNEVISSAKWEKSVSEIINDLSLTVQNLVAGTGTVSTNVLSDGCMQLKIHLPEKSPNVLLQFPLDSNLTFRIVNRPLAESGEEEDNSDKDKNVHGNKTYSPCRISESDTENFLTLVPLKNCEQGEVTNEKVKNRYGNKTYSRYTRVCEDVTKNLSTTTAVVKPLLNYNKVGETENNETVIKVFGSKTYSRCRKVCDGVKANLSTLTPVIKQEKPELLAVLSESTQNDEEHLQKDQIKGDHPQTNVSNELNAYCQSESKDKISSSAETEYIEVTPDVDMSLFQTKSLELNSEIATIKNMFKINVDNKGPKTHEQRMRRVNKPFSRIYCQKSFNTKHEQKKHELIHTGDKFFSRKHIDPSDSPLSTVSSQKRNHKNSLQTHKRTNANEKLFSSSNCAASLNKTKKTNKGFHLCLVCGKTFTNTNLLEEHEKIHSN